MTENRTRTSGVPLWVKVFGAIALVVIVVVVIMLVTGGDHGPSRHTPGDDTSVGQTGPPPGISHEQS